MAQSLMVKKCDEFNKQLVINQLVKLSPLMFLYENNSQFFKVLLIKFYVSYIHQSISLSNFCAMLDVPQSN